MSLRYLKFETEHENGMVDERGVLLPNAAGGATIVEIESPSVYDGELYDKLLKMAQNGQPICFYYSGMYIYPTCVKQTVVSSTTESDEFSHQYTLSFGVAYYINTNTLNSSSIFIHKRV